MPEPAQTRLSVFHAPTARIALSEHQLDELTQLAKQVCSAPMAGVTFIDERGNLVVAGAILSDLAEYPFCSLTIDEQRPVIVCDARADARFVDCELVRNAPFIRFYAGAPLVMPEGECVGVLWVADPAPRAPEAFDVTGLERVARQLVGQLALRRANALLAQREIELRSIIASSGEAIYGLDAEGRCTFVNPACLRILGYEEPEQLLGRLMHDVVHYAHADGSRYPAEQCRLLQAVRAGEHVRLEEELLWRKDGTPFWAINTACPLHDGGELIGAVISFVDVTEQRRARDELTMAAQVRDRFTSVLGHDLRSPLATVLLGAQRIARSETSEGTRRVALRVGRAAERMQRLIGDLLDFMRVREGGALILASRQMDLARVARDIVAEFEIAHPTRSIALETSGEAIGIWDPDRLAQACSNLLANAIEHGAPESTVSMRVGMDCDNAMLSVENDGPAIPDDLRPHLFDPFRRGVSGRGLGLGLFIVSEVARAHGGDVAFTSDAQGTMFTVRLPCGRAA